MFSVIISIKCTRTRRNENVPYYKKRTFALRTIVLILKDDIKSYPCLKAKMAGLLLNTMLPRCCGKRSLLYVAPKDFQIPEPSLEPRQRISRRGQLWLLDPQKSKLSWNGKKSFAGKEGFFSCTPKLQSTESNLNSIQRFLCSFALHTSQVIIKMIFDTIWFTALWFFFKWATSKAF